MGPHIEVYTLNAASSSWSECQLGVSNKRSELDAQTFFAGSCCSHTLKHVANTVCDKVDALNATGLSSLEYPLGVSNELSS